MRCVVALAAALFMSDAFGQAEILRAEERGLALFQAYERNAKTDAQAKTIADSAPVERCATPYRAVALTPKLVYLLADPSNAVALGRHFRVEVDDNGKMAVAPSSATCLEIDDPSSASAGATRPARASIVHTLSDVPTEFHVFLSLRHAMPIYVATSAGLWKVEAGLVQHLGATRRD